MRSHGKIHDSGNQPSRLICTDAFWLRTLTHVTFNHVNKIEARYKVLRLNVKLNEVLLLRLRAAFDTLPVFHLLT